MLDRYIDRMVMVWYVHEGLAKCAFQNFCFTKNQGQKKIWKMIIGQSH